MIRRIGVLCQDRNSFGFLAGIAKRLGCDAELVEPTTGSLAKSTLMTRKQAKIATKDLLRKSVDLIVRFTDADGRPWQDVKRHELELFEGDVRSLIVCGVAVDNVEHWLAIDPQYLESRLNLVDLQNATRDEATGSVKHAIAQHGAPASETVSRIVREAPPEVFRRWLSEDSALQRFYQDCRAAALRQSCLVTNELGD